MKPLALIFALILLFSSCRREVKNDEIRLSDYDNLEENDTLSATETMMPDSAAADTVVVDSTAMDTLRKENMAE